MNPIKADKLLLGSLATHPSLSRGSSSELVFFDQQTGAISLSTLVGERGIDNVVTVSKTSSGADFATIQEAVDFLPATGGAVIVYEGVYEESLSVSKPLFLVARGEVVVQATDAPCVTVTNASLRAFNLSFVVKALVGNNNTSAVTASVVDISDSVSFVECVFDTSADLNATFLTSTKASLVLSSCRFVGGGSVSVSGAVSCELVGASLPDIELTSILSQGYISSAQILGVSLVDTSLTLTGNATAITGDADSRLTKNVVTGVSTFAAEAVKDVSFDCPLSSDSYVVVLEPNSQGDLPIVSLKTEAGFRLTYGGALNEDVRWSALS